MSVRKFTLELTDLAQTDFRDVLSYTLGNWGEGQFAEYKRKINEALITITENPGLGRKRHGLLVYPPDFLSRGKYDHFVIRILHDRMDAIRHLPTS